MKVIAKGFALYEQQGVEVSAGQVQKLAISLQIEAGSAEDHGLRRGANR